jgi:PhnB protein
MILAPYLTLDGCCEQAMNFYAKCFDGEISVMNRYAESPEEIPESYHNKIMHSEIVFNGNHLQGCDADPQTYLKRGNDYSLSISVVEVFVLDKVFSRLAEGGEIIMPLQDTFWGARFGIIRDKFGIRWLFSCDLN